MRRLLRFPAASDILTRSGSLGLRRWGRELRAGRGGRNAAAGARGDRSTAAAPGWSGLAGPHPPGRGRRAGAGAEGPASQPGTLYLEAGVGAGGRRRDTRRLRAEDTGDAAAAAGGRRRAVREGADCGKICRGKILRTAIPRLLSAAWQRPATTPGAQGRVFGNRWRPLAAARLPASAARLTDSLLP